MHVASSAVCMDLQWCFSLCHYRLCAPRLHSRSAGISKELRACFAHQLCARNNECNGTCALWVQKGMSGPDFEHYAQLRPDLVRQTDANTINVPGGLIPNPWNEHAPHVKTVPVDTLKHLLESVEHEHVVYLSDIFLVSQEGRAGNKPGTCVPNCDYDAMSPGLEKKLKQFESVQGCYPFNSYMLGSSP